MEQTKTLLFLNIGSLYLGRIPLFNVNSCGALSTYMPRVLWDIGKQCRSRPDATESGFPLLLHVLECFIKSYTKIIKKALKI